MEIQNGAKNYYQFICFHPDIFLLYMESYAESVSYVCQSGNDSWSGKISVPNKNRADGPFALLEKARDEVRKVKLSDPRSEHSSASFVNFERCQLCQRENCPGRRAPYDGKLYIRKYCRKS